MKTLTLKVPESLDRALSAKARRLGRTKSAALRQAVREWLANESRPREVSCLEAAGDLVGSVEGPPDLSTNPKYLDGFGQ